MPGLEWEDKWLRTIEELYKKLLLFPKQEFGRFPTPLHRLARVSEDFGVNLYIKRDDLCGYNLYGGNKIRKLQYLLGDALAKGKSAVYTFGATQSNHAMQTAACARSCGMQPILFLEEMIEQDGTGARANLLLDQLYQAEIFVISAQGQPIGQVTERAYQKAEQVIRAYEDAGIECYRIETGGANPLGCLGFVEGYAELISQLREQKIRADYLCLPVGTGGTYAGLVAGKALLGGTAEILGYTVLDKTEEFENELLQLARQTVELLGEQAEVSAADIRLKREYYGKGYELPDDAANKAIRYLAATEGILTDPVYSGKALAGVFDQIQKGYIAKGSNIVFWHTGGTTALFAEKEILGTLVEEKQVKENGKF